MMINCPTVTTPVPPIPATSRSKLCSREGSSGAGNAVTRSLKSAVCPQRRGLFQAATLDTDEAGTETLHAGEILVAGRLVDLALATSSVSSG